MLLMLGIVLSLRPGERLGCRIGEGSSRSRPGVLGSGSKSEKGEWEKPNSGVVGEGVAVVVGDTGVSLKKASNRRWSSAVAVGERTAGRLTRWYERGPKLRDGAEEVLGRSTSAGGESIKEGRRSVWLGWLLKNGVTGARTGAGTGAGEATGFREGGDWETVVLERGRGSGTDDILLL